MGKRACFVLSLTACLILLGATHLYCAPAPVKLSIFNFQPLNIETSTLGTTVTNMLITSLAAESGLAILDRKELETFLMLNDMQQNEKLDNIAAIGGRLGLDAIVIGTVDKKGSVLLINCKIVHIEQKKVIFSQQLRSLGDARLAAELSGLAKGAAKALLALSAKPKEDAFCRGPVNVQKRPGNRRIQLSWEKAPGTSAMAYEVFRATNEKGPYAKVGQVTQPEFVDQDLENKVVYYYKIRAYDEKGLPSEYSDTCAAETALTPNAPVLLKADSHIKSIQLTWTPSPMASSDPLKLKGYKIYRAPTEQGTYKEVANASGEAIASEGATADRLPRITFTDKGLTDGEVCYYRLTAYNEKNLESEFSSSLKGATIAAISDVAIQGDLIREIRLSWPALEAPAIKGYAVYRSDKEDQGFKRIKVLDFPAAAGAKKVQFQDTEGLGDLLRYYYKITAWESPDLESAPSAVVSAQTKGKPPVPEGVQALSGLVKKVEITWLASKSEDVEGYKIYGSRQKDGEFVLIKRVAGRTNNKFTDEERDNGKLEDNGTYYYRMTTYNKVEVESSSVLAAATTKPRPVKPRSLQGEALKVKEIPLSWQANPEADIAYYHILRSNSENDDFGRVARVAAGKTSYLDKDLKDGAAYRYALQAEDRAGLLSDFSEILRMQTKPRPKTPSAFSGAVSGERVNLTWERGAEPDIAFYTIYEKKFFGLEKIATPAGPTFSEASPALGKSKTYVLTVTDRDGLESEPSAEVTVTGR